MSQKNPRSCPIQQPLQTGDVHQAHHHASRYIYERFPRSRTMTSHGSALLSLLYVHSQANLINIYFDHTSIIMYNISRIKIPWLRSFAVGTNSTLNFSRFFSQPGFSLWLK